MPYIALAIQYGMVGHTISHFRILEKIGAGSMGEVFKAEDLNLGRNVALKFLAEHLLGDDGARKRFHREARATAALAHPNICTVYEVSEAEGKTFLAMELVEGEGLDHLLKKGLLPLADALDITWQIAEGLRESHEKGVLHRDIKPSNIMLTEIGEGVRRVKVLDFGLARLTRAAEVSSGGQKGTPAYMAPEQIMGTLVDSRADIWALGVVLFEMVTGRRPFEDEYIEAIQYSILHESAPALRQFRPEAPAELEAIVSRALAKEAVLRYASIHEFIVDLAAVRRASTHTFPTGGSRTRSQTPSLAVLPFFNLSPKEDTDYLSDGITDEITTALARIRDLQVVSRTSAFQFKGQARDVREIGRLLHVVYILEGTVKWVGSRVRVAAQLISVGAGYQIWSGRYECTFTDLLDVEHEVAIAIINTLRGTLEGSDYAKAPRIESSEAHEHYLRGRYFFNVQSEVAIRLAIKEYERAAHIAPRYSLPYVGLAEAYLALDWYGADSPASLLPKAREAANIALTIDQSNPIARGAQATLNAAWDFDWPNAEAEFERALAVGSGLSSIYFYYALDFLTPLGRLEAAENAIRTALELDPLSPLLKTALGGCLYRQRQFDSAARYLKGFVEQHPDFGLGHWGLGRALQQLGETEASIHCYSRASDLLGNLPAVQGDLGHILATTGKGDEAAAILRHLEEVAESRYVSPLCFACVWLGLADYEKAVGAVRQAVAQRDHPVLWVLVDPRFDVPGLRPALLDALMPTGLSAFLIPRRK